FRHTGDIEVGGHKSGVRDCEFRSATTTGEADQGHARGRRFEHHKWERILPGSQSEYVHGGEQLRRTVQRTDEADLVTQAEPLCIHKELSAIGSAGIAAHPDETNVPIT